MTMSRSSSEGQIMTSWKLIMKIIVSVSSRKNQGYEYTDKYFNIRLVWTCSQLGYGTQESVYLEARDRNFRDNNPEWYRELVDRMVTKESF